MNDNLLGSEKVCDLSGCSEYYERDGDYWEVTSPDEYAFGKQFCSANCAKIHLMRIEREQDGEGA